MRIAAFMKPSSHTLSQFLIEAINYFILKQSTTSSFYLHICCAAIACAAAATMVPRWWREQVHKTPITCIVLSFISAVLPSPALLQPQWCHVGGVNKCNWSTYPTLFMGEGQRPFLKHSRDLAIQTPLVLFLVGEAILYKILLGEQLRGMLWGNVCCGVTSGIQTG